MMAPQVKLTVPIQPTGKEKSIIFVMLVFVYSFLICNFSDGESIINDQRLGGRKSAVEVWTSAHHGPIVPGLESIYQPCNSRCYLSGHCAKDIPGEQIPKLRKLFHGTKSKEAPKDKERAERIIEILKKARKDKDDNLIFKIGEKEVCMPTFLRFLGVLGSPDMRDAPGQWTRLLKGYIEGQYDKDYLLRPEDIKLDAGEGYLSKEGHCTAFINDYLSFHSDAIPLEIAEDAEGNLISTRVPPFRRKKDFFSEYCFNCECAEPPILKGERAEEQTFINAFNKLEDKKVIKCMGGKSGFPCCGQCISMLSMKTSASCRRDTITCEVLKKLARLHLLQQSTERQHAENFILECKKINPSGQPGKAYLNIDASSVWTGNTPKLTKLRKVKQNTHIENRNFGCRIVCGPIDEYISVCTNNLIPGGANVLIDIVKYCMEYLGRRLQEFAMVMPKKIGLHFDNSGENKVRFIFF